MFSGGFFGLGRGRVEGRGYVGGSFYGGTSHGGRDFRWEGAQDFLALFKKTMNKINMKSFFLLKVRSSIKTEDEQTL